MWRVSDVKKDMQCSDLCDNRLIVLKLATHPDNIHVNVIFS